jgi:hypothetical protein
MPDRSIEPLSDSEQPDTPPDSLLHEAWGLLANGRSLDPAFAEDWNAAMFRWRDHWHAYLDAQRMVPDA